MPYICHVGEMQAGCHDGGVGCGGLVSGGQKVVVGGNELAMHDYHTTN